MNKIKFKKLIENQIIVSCQAVDQERLNDVKAITLMAHAVLDGGAKVLRLSQEEHIKSIKAISPYPVIGLIKQKYLDSEVFISATKKEIDTLLNLGVECIALDATLRKRPNDEKLEDLISYIRDKSPETFIMADCSNYEDVTNADALGVDFIGTTLRGYTKETQGLSNIENDYDFIKKCLRDVKTPIIAEGGFWEHDDIYNALNLGCLAVVVGSAITRPRDICSRYLTQLEKRKSDYGFKQNKK